MGTSRTGISGGGEAEAEEEEEEEEEDGIEGGHCDFFGFFHGDLFVVEVGFCSTRKRWVLLFCFEQDFVGEKGDRMEKQKWRFWLKVEEELTRLGL